MTPRTGALLTGCLVLALSLGGCTRAAPTPTPTAPAVDVEGYDPAAGNGLWLVAPADAVDEIVGAMRDAGSVHVTGTFTETVQPDAASDPVAGRTVTVDYRGTPEAFAATLIVAGSTVELFVADGVGRERRDGGPVQCTVGSDAVTTPWSPLIDPVALLRSVAASSGVTVPAPVDGAPTDGSPADPVLDVVIGEGDAPVGVIAVDRFGPPLPLRLTAADASGTGEFVFADWGVPADLATAAASLPCP